MEISSKENRKRVGEIILPESCFEYLANENIKVFSQEEKDEVRERCVKTTEGDYGEFWVNDPAQATAAQNSEFAPRPDGGLPAAPCSAVSTAEEFCPYDSTKAEVVLNGLCSNCGCQAEFKTVIKSSVEGLDRNWSDWVSH